LAKLIKAAEFAHVPGDWGIEAKRPTEEEDEVLDEGEEGKLKIRRQKANLDEDQLAELWKDVYDIVEEVSTNVDNQQEEDESGSSDDEMEDVVGTGTGTPAQGAAGEKEEKIKEEQPMMSLETLHRFMSTGSTFR
jgi:hypothetical protein